MRFCATQLQPIEAASKSDPYKKYTVELRPVDSAHPSCSCMAWIMARSRARKALNGAEVNADLPGKCKHLTAALSQACTWEGEAQTCPSCGSPTVALEEAATAERPVIVAEPEGPTPTVGMPELRPMLAEEVNADTLPGYIADDGWWMDQKADGHRVLIHVQAGGVTVLGRGGQDSQHGARFHRSAYADISRLPDCVLDGELVGDVFYAFDLPHHDGEGVTVDSQYRDRREALERVFAAWSPDDRYYRLLPTAKTAVEKGELALRLLRAKAEGIMVKDLTGTYRPGGRVRTILKAKFVSEIDAVIIEVGHQGKDNYSLGVYRDGDLVEVGRCSSIGKTKCAVGDVATIRFLYLAANERLYQPRFLVKRTDKAPEECMWETQLVHAHVNKEVLA